MFDLILFADGSVDTKTRIGFGAYLAVNDITQPITALKAKVKVKQFENTSSTTLELQTLLWAVGDVILLSEQRKMQIVIYSDSQNIVGLLARRSGLERRGYLTNNGKRLNNAELYQQFFNMMDRCNCQIIKVDGHNPQHLKSNVDRVFASVDKAARSALRNFNKNMI